MRLLCGIYEDGLSLPEMVSGNRLCGRRLICNTHLSPKCYDLLCFSNSMMERPFISQYCGKNSNTRPWTCTSKQVVKSCCHEYHLCSATHNNHRSFVSFLWLLIFTLSLWIVWLLCFPRSVQKVHPSDSNSRRRSIFLLLAKIHWYILFICLLLSRLGPFGWNKNNVSKKKIIKKGKYNKIKWQENFKDFLAFE